MTHPQSKNSFRVSACGRYCLIHSTVPCGCHCDRHYADWCSYLCVIAATSGYCTHYFPLNSLPLLLLLLLLLPPTSIVGRATNLVHHHLHHDHHHTENRQTALSSHVVTLLCSQPAPASRHTTAIHPSINVTDK